MIKKINVAIGNGLDLNDKTDADSEEDIHPSDCKYYTIFNKQKFNSIKHFSILHLNIHSLEFHIEELRIALKLINFKFDFICITESKIRKNIEPKTDITIRGGSSNFPDRFFKLYTYLLIFLLVSPLLPPPHPI